MKLYKFIIVNNRPIVDVSEDEDTIVDWAMKMGYPKSAVVDAIGGCMDDSGIWFYNIGEATRNICVTELWLSSLCTWYCARYGKRPECVHTGVTNMGGPLKSCGLDSYTLGIPGDVAEYAYSA